jgi:hypothetical protein
VLIYFALYQVEGFAISEVNNTLDASWVVIEWGKRILYLSLFYLLTLCFITLFVVNGKENKLLFFIFWIGIALLWYKICTSNLLLCKWWYCSFYWYVDLVINMFFSLTVAYVISLLCLLWYYCYKKFMHKRRK